jgi:uncharacterized protein YeaO (DUF488 family)
MIRVKRIYEAPDDADGFRVLVDRLWPRGIRKQDADIDLWLRDIAPSADLRRWFRHDPTKWSEFCRRYAGELKSKPAEVTSLRDRTRAGTVTLVYSAADVAHNNAVALKRFLDA